MSGRGGGDAAAPIKGSKRPRKAAPTRRGPVRSTEASVELRRVAGRGASCALQDLERAAEAFNAGHERDAMRILRPLRDAYPDVAAIRELVGLCHYRSGQFPAAARELGTFADLTGSVEQHPVLMDCAWRNEAYARVESLWDELSAASPTAALVTEGRIVMAGALTDRGRSARGDCPARTAGQRRATSGRTSSAGLVHAGRSAKHRRPAAYRRAVRSCATPEHGFADVAERLVALS